MGRYLEAKCKICRRNKEKLYLKGARCESAKCAMEKRNYPPGIRTAVAKKMSEYGKRLREKQKLRFFYGVSEVQMRNYFAKASNQKGISGHNLLTLFERRLDNVLYRAKLATSRKEARIMVRHRHFLINGRLTNIASHLVSPNDVITINPTSAQIFEGRFQTVKEKGVGTWLSFDEPNKSIKIVHLPSREEIDSPVQEQLIVEFYSM